MNIFYQLKSKKATFLKIFSISIFFISCVILLNKWKGIPIGSMTRDITTSANVPLYIGFFSQVGFMFWIASATLCIFSSHLNKKNQGNPMFQKFLFLSGLLSLLLCFDDMFLLHESVFPGIFGIPEKGVFITYGILLIFLLVKYYSVIIKTDYTILATALLFFAISIGLDLIHIPNINPYLLEDGAKMIGIVSWFFYFCSNYSLIISNLSKSMKDK
ncbi:hypothetical protein [Winogradskyella sp.]|uniref:hypothetical protein n=1 Tax=Winogradskyella sp. TaxID=1883156 RepID=UPI0025E578F6|nr:hypothetical protein [Winogradskyella sp.]